MIEAENLSFKFAIIRLTALWALSESVLGGILHGFHIPFRGLIISSISVTIISLIYYFSKNPNQIIKSVLLVLMVKLAVSPNTPVNAYIALSYQSFIGFILFKLIPSFKTATFLLACSALLAGGLQKILTLTILFGFRIWELTDELARDLFILLGITQSPVDSINFSIVIISIYIFIHLTAGVITGIIAGKIPIWLKNPKLDKFQDGLNHLSENIPGTEQANQKRSQTKSKFSKPAIFFLLTVLLLITFIVEKDFSNRIFDIAILFLRSVILIFIWFKIISPILIKSLIKFLNISNSRYAKDVNEIVNFFPELKKIINYCWKFSLKERNYRTRFKTFIEGTIHLLLIFPGR